MPSLGLGAGDAVVLIDYIDKQSRAARNGTGTSGETATRATTAPASLKPIVDPYLRIQRELNADSLGDTRNDARRIAAEAGKLGAGGAAIEAAAVPGKTASKAQPAKTRLISLRQPLPQPRSRRRNDITAFNGTSMPDATQLNHTVVSR